MTTKPKPPIRCTPCTVRYEDETYYINSRGEVFLWGPRGTLTEPEPEETARMIRQHASRLRRNRNARERYANARERNQARRDLGMKQTPYGWE